MPVVSHPQQVVHNDLPPRLRAVTAAECAVAAAKRDVATAQLRVATAEHAVRDMKICLDSKIRAADLIRAAGGQPVGDSYVPSSAPSEIDNSGSRHFPPIEEIEKDLVIFTQRVDAARSALSAAEEALMLSRGDLFSAQHALTRAIDEAKSGYIPPCTADSIASVVESTSSRKTSSRKTSSLKTRFDQVLATLFRSKKL